MPLLDLVPPVQVKSKKWIFGSLETFDSSHFLYKDLLNRSIILEYDHEAPQDLVALVQVKNNKDKEVKKDKDDKEDYDDK